MSVKQLQQKGAKVLIINQKREMIDLKELMKELGNLEITSIMIEGGAELNSSAIKERIADKLLIFTAPKLVGNGLGAIGNLGITKIDKAIKLKDMKMKKIGKDILLEAYL